MRLRELRLQRRMSQGALADAVGLSFQQIQKYEKGINRISASILTELARVLEVPIASFFDGVDNASYSASPPAYPSRVDLEIAALVGRIQDRELKRRVYALLQALVHGDGETPRAT